MEEFAYLDYHTKYSSTGDLEVDMQTDACFSIVFNGLDGDMTNEYTVVMYEGTGFCAKNHKNNALLMSRAELRNHIERATNVVPFKFKVKNYKPYKDYKRVSVICEVSGNPGAHKFVLAWIRYAYEYPFNVLLMDAYKLQKEPMFKWVSIFDLMNLTLSCYPEYCREIHCIIDPDYAYHRMTIKHLRNQIKLVKYLNEIYQCLKHEDEYIKFRDETYNADGLATDLDYWINNFEERKPYYIRNYVKYLCRR